MPILGPHIGAVLGSLLYDLFVGLHWPPAAASYSDDPIGGHDQGQPSGLAIDMKVLQKHTS